MRSRALSFLTCLFGAFLVSAAAPVHAQPPPLKGAILVVDPGHGGQRYSRSYTGGTRGVVSRLTESELNLRVAVELAKLLREQGATVTMTREGDHRLSPEGSSRADELHARVDFFEHDSPHFFLSVHHNAGPGTATGHTALYKHNAKDDTLYEALARDVNDALEGVVPGPKRNLIKGDYHILRETSIPGTISESGFMTNQAFDELSTKPDYPRKEAEAICKGAIKYWTEHKDALVSLREQLKKERAEHPREARTFTAIDLNPEYQTRMKKLLAEIAPGEKYDPAKVGEYIENFRKQVVTDPQAKFTVKGEFDGKQIKLTGETSDRKYHDQLINVLIAMKLYDIANEIKLPAAARTTARSWRAGVAHVSITPERPMWLSGYAARTHPADGKLDDLWAKALALEDPSGRRAVLITMDLVGIDRNLSLAVRDELKAKYGLGREAVILSCSHTHSGPVVHDNLRTMYPLNDEQQRLVEEYAEGLRAKLVALAGDALKNLAPARLAHGDGKATFAVNRRNNKESDVPKLRETGQLKGPVDHDVPVLAIRDAEDHLVAVVFGYACHATVLDGYRWSADYPGAAQRELEKTYPGVTALFWAGCGGDQNPLPRRSVAHVEGYGRQLADAVDRVLRAPMTPITGSLGMAYTEIDLPFGELPSREQLVRDTMSDKPQVVGRARQLLQQLERDGTLRGTYPYPVQAWQFGPDLTLVALGGEVVVDYALRFKKELGPGTTWVASYSNDVMAYIPSLRVLNEGGYEGGGAMLPYGLPTAWGPRVEELIVAAVLQQTQRARTAAASGERQSR